MTGFWHRRAAGGSLNGTLLPDGPNGLWVPSSQGLYYFDRQPNVSRTGFSTSESNPDSLDSNAVFSVYRDRGGVLWVGTENTGLNILNFRQQQFNPYSASPRRPQ